MANNSTVIDELLLFNDLLKFISSHETGCALLFVIVVLFVLVLICTPTSKLVAAKCCVYQILVEWCPRVRRSRCGESQQATSSPQPGEAV